MKLESAIRGAYSTQSAVALGDSTYVYTFAVVQAFGLVASQHLLQGFLSVCTTYAAIQYERRGCDWGWSWSWTDGTAYTCPKEDKTRTE